MDKFIKFFFLFFCQSKFSSASSDLFDPIKARTAPPIRKPIPPDATPNTDVPRAIPPPPITKLPPPKHAKTAFVNAAPLNVEIAVPVDAVPNAVTRVVIDPAAANPPATPAAAPDRLAKAVSAQIDKSFRFRSFNLGISMLDIPFALICSLKSGIPEIFL